MEIARVNGFRGAARLGCSVAVDMQLKQTPFAHHGAKWGKKHLTAKRPRRSRCVSQCSSELTQALRSFLTATSDSKAAVMPSSQIGPTGTGVAACAGAAVAVTLPVEPVLGVKVRCGLSQPVAPRP